MKIFLAFAFRDEDKELVGHIDRLISSQYVQTITGENLGGEILGPAVQQRIDKCDAIVGVLTRRDAKQAGGFTTHPWVIDELGYARAKGKRAIALVETEVDIGGMYQPNEHIPFDRAELLPALLRLSETVGMWRQEQGRMLKVQILPAALAKNLKAGNNGVACAHRLWLQGSCTPWTSATPVPEPGGTFIYIPGVQEDHSVQVEVRYKGKVWQSLAVCQWTPIELASGSGK